jgi:NAD(P)-dependent dehydrogenase (short-subunit alcohol dehydrogenase family)
MTTSVVTGANRGIGLELVRQLLPRGSVIAAARDPGSADELRALEAASGGKLRIVRCDVADGESVGQLARAIAGAPVDLLINNAGVYGGSHQQLGDVDFDDALRTYEINGLGPLRVTFALLPNLRAGKGKLVAHVSSGMGSIEDNGSGGYYAYRMSKAALNMASRSLSVDLRPDGIRSVVLNPGWVQTDMGGSSAPTSPADSVAGMLARLDAMTAKQSGSFLNWSGGEYPW